MEMAAQANEKGKAQASGQSGGIILFFFLNYFLLSKRFIFCAELS